MDIKYLGHASFQMKGKTAVVVTDPFDSKMVGLKYPKVDADIVTVSHNHGDHNQVALVGGNPLVVDWPGEYEKQNVRITGYPTYHDKVKGAEKGENVMYKIEMEGLSILHCGDLGHTLEDKFSEQVGAIDVLMIPVGGYYTINADEANAVIRELEPSIVIPMHYNQEGMNQEAFAQVAPLSEFLKKMGAESVELVSKLTIKKEELTEGMKIVPMVISV